MDGYSTVYQYVPTPISLPNSSVHFLIDPMDDFLADNRQTHIGTGIGIGFISDYKSNVQHKKKGTPES